MDASEISKHFTLEEAHTLPDTWYHSARSALWAADFLDNHTMESLQCILLLGVFLVGLFSREDVKANNFTEQPRSRRRGLGFTRCCYQNGTRPWSLPSRCRATVCRRQAVADVDRSMGKSYSARSWQAYMVEFGLPRLVPCAELQLFVQYPAGSNQDCFTGQH